MVPKLRFSEFSKGWQQKKIGDVFTIFSGFAFKSTDATTSGCRWLKIADVGCQIMTPSTPSFLPNHFRNEYHKFIIRKDDHVIALTRPILNGKLKIAIAGKEYDGSLLNQRVGKIVTKNNPKFVYSLLQMESTVSKINNCIAGTDPPNLSTQDIKDMVVFVPIIEEQTKIADFLSSVDEKITLLNKQYDLLCQYKKGMMQKIFSQELKFNSSTPWKTESLFGLAINNTLTNGVFNDPMNTGSGYKLINVVNMYKEPFIDESDLTLLTLDEKTFNKNKVRNGDIFFTRSSLVKEGIAWSNIYTGNSEDVTYDGHLIKMTPDKKKVFPQFLYYCLKIPQVRNQLIKGGKTATMTTIGQNDVGNTLLQIPSLNEQTKIANFLSAFDDKIAAKKAELNKLKTWKQGLLQQMFV